MLVWLIALASLVYGQPVLSCPIDEVLQELQLPEDRRSFSRFPLQQRQWKTLHPSRSGKQVYSHGGEWGWNGPARTSDNFFITWQQGQASPEAVDRTEEWLEQAWQALIVAQGWPKPITSEQYLLWVVLDPTIEHTGVTYPYWSDQEQGYLAVIYLNPIWIDYVDFYQALVHHEFMHAIQFAMRTRYEDDEYWYWEASAQWAPELVDAGVDGYHYSVENYANFPWYRYDSMEDQHQYGMCVLNAYMEEHVLGAGGMLSIWELAREIDDSWDTVLETATGLDKAELWGGFTSAFANRALHDSAIYPSVYLRSALTPEATGSVAYLGTDYYWVDADYSLVVSGDVVASSPHGTGQEIQIRSGDLVAITGLRDGASYQLELYDPIFPEEPFEQETENSDDDASGLATSNGAQSKVEVSTPASCQVLRGGSSWYWLTGVLLGLGWRRQSRSNRASV